MQQSKYEIIKKNTHQKFGIFVVYVWNEMPMRLIYTEKKMINMNIQILSVLLFGSDAQFIMIIRSYGTKPIGNAITYPSLKFQTFNKLQPQSKKYAREKKTHSHTALSNGTNQVRGKIKEHIPIIGNKLLKIHIF